MRQPNCLSEKEIRYAFRLWYFKNFSLQEDEKFLEPFLTEKIQSNQNNRSWLKICREGLQLTSSHIAKKLNVSRQGYESFELSEKTKTITLANLMKVAEAMDCELVYAIRPKSRKKFSEIAWEKALPGALAHPWLTKCDQGRRAHAIAHIAALLMKSPRFRREQNWSKQKN